MPAHYRYREAKMTTTDKFPCLAPIVLKLIEGTILVLSLLGGGGLSLIASPPDEQLEHRIHEIEVTAKQADSEPAQIAVGSMAAALAGTLARSDDFLRVGAALNFPDLGDFRTARERYELVLAAAALGEKDTGRGLADAWDNLLLTLGRPVRFDSEKAEGLGWGDCPSGYSPVPKSIRAVYFDQLSRVATSDNPELIKLESADQEIRRHFKELSHDQLLQMVADDRLRIDKIRRFIERGKLHTSRDFRRAALILQHSNGFYGYELAHELAVAAVLLGDKETGLWLVAATYDRMLCSAGADQRFGTQSYAVGMKPVDREGISNFERHLFRCPDLP
jgi:hypothetical protein